MSRRLCRRAACLLAAAVALAALAVAAAAAGMTILAVPSPDGFSKPYVTWIENRASGVFDPATPQIRGQQAAYRVDAHVLLPLGFTSLELWSRADVGSAVASYRDCAADGTDVVRAYELFSASRPERARGFDRRGFFREAVRITPGGIAWTAYFGAMTSWPEKTLAEARRAADGPQPHTYEAIDGFSAPLETSAAVFLVATDRKLAGPDDLWAAVRPQLDTRPPRHLESLVGTSAKPLPALAFLGALEVSLRSAAVHREVPLPPKATRVAFTHNGQVRQLELMSLDKDPDRAQTITRPGLVRNRADVYLLRYRIINPGSDDGEFRLWAELPGGVRDDPHAPPIAPLAWELQLRSYLKLVFERTN